MEQVMVSDKAVVRRSLAEFREERTEGALLRPGDRVSVGLDGEVTFIDALGDDQRIVDAARVSYQQGTKAHRSTAGLIDFLIRHKHTSPLEQVEIVLRVRCPMFIARQLMRHRTACLAGDAKLYFDLPCAAQRKGPKGRRRHNVTLAEFHHMWHNGTQHPITKRKPLHLDRVDPNKFYRIAELAKLVERRTGNLQLAVNKGHLEVQHIPQSDSKQHSIQVKGAAWHCYAKREFTATVPMKDRLASMRLRSCNEDTGEIGYTKVVDVWESGVKPVFEVTLANGYTLKMSRDHRCLTEEGWLTLAEASQMVVREDGLVTWQSKGPKLAVNGIEAYKDHEWLGARRAEGLSVPQIADAAGISYHTIRKYLRQFGLQFTASERAKLSGQVQRGQRRCSKGRRVLSDEHLAKIRQARSGAQSNFWKGGVTSERANIGRWTVEHARATHERFGFACALCGARDRLHAHHIDPVWHAPELARNEANLMSLCTPCHQRIHAQNLELSLLAAKEEGQDLMGFWLTHSDAVPRPEAKALPAPKLLVRQFSAIESIRLVGEEMTYDLEVEGPFHNFVANGFIVHNSVNEVSARYSELPEEYWLPPVGDFRMQGDQANKQMSGQAYPEQVGTLLQKMMETASQASFNVYHKLLAVGLSREQARSVLPVSTYTEFYWKQDLHNYLHLCNLRADAHAQPEVQAYAEVLIEIARSVAPLAVASWENHIRNSVTLSQDELVWLPILLTRFATSDTYPPELEEQLGKSRAEELWKKVYRIQKNGAKL